MSGHLRRQGSSGSRRGPIGGCGPRTGPCPRRAGRRDRPAGARRPPHRGRRGHQRRGRPDRVGQRGLRADVRVRQEAAVGRRRIELVRGPFTRTPEFARLADELATLRPDHGGVRHPDQGRGRPTGSAMTVKPVVEDGRVVGSIGVERDVTPAPAGRGAGPADAAPRRVARRRAALREAPAHRGARDDPARGLVEGRRPALRRREHRLPRAARVSTARPRCVGRLEGQLDTGRRPRAASSPRWRTRCRDRASPVVDATVTLGRPTARSARSW